MALLKGNPEESKGAIIGGVIYMILVWIVFWEFIQPALASLSSVFIYDPEGLMGRYPDGPVVTLLFVIILLGLLSYYMLLAFLYEGIGEFLELIEAIYILVVLLPLGVIVSVVLPKFGIDRWDSDTVENEP